MTGNDENADSAEVLAINKLQERYLAAMHGVQTGVAVLMERDADGDSTTPKHLRVGVNSAMVGQAALAKLLIDLGVVTERQLWEHLVTAAEDERERYQTLVRDILGPGVNLL